MEATARKFRKTTSHDLNRVMEFLTKDKIGHTAIEAKKVIRAYGRHRAFPPATSYAVIAKEIQSDFTNFKTWAKYHTDNE